LVEERLPQRRHAERRNGKEALRKINAVCLSFQAKRASFTTVANA
jgi:hypothetical protein